jgi:pyroglutamyl-peptidase
MAAIVLLTGFEPFGGEDINPSWELARALDGEEIAGHRVVAVRLPCAFGIALDVLRDAIARHDPVLVLAIGQAGGRGQMSLERVAINLDDARIPDNAGAQPVDAPIVAEGVPAYFSRLPIKAMLSALLEAGIPAEISQTAGTYVCNHVFYGLMHALAERPGVRGGFVHIPYLPEQAALHPGAPSLPLAVGIEGVRLALRVALAVDRDVALAGGALH